MDVHSRAALRLEEGKMGPAETGDEWGPQCERQDKPWPMKADVILWALLVLHCCVGSSLAG